VTTPMSPPTFFHNYIGDIFTSMVKIFQDLAWTFFFVISGDWMISEDRNASMKHVWSQKIWYTNVLIPLLTLLPLWFRFNQCLRRYADSHQRWPHLGNAMKYALSMTVTLFGAFHPLTLRSSRDDFIQRLWMLNFITSSLYSFWWDVYMDWGLGRLNFNMLGPRLMYPSHTSYYVVMALDLVLRFAWVLTLVPPHSGASFALPAYLTAVSMLLELFRRTIWGFLRLENEHRSNTAGYRRVDFVSGQHGCGCPVTNGSFDKSDDELTLSLRLRYPSQVPLHFSTGHNHGYKKEQEHRGGTVLIEVGIVTTLVLAAAIGSVVAAQHMTERMEGMAGGEL
jgi:hypothetical protein